MATFAKRKIQIAPSILSADFANLGADCQMVLDAGANMLHIDVMDGHFVPNLSVGIPVVKSLRKAFPNVFFDTHLMLEQPLQYVNAFAEAGASLISFHLEAASPIHETIDAIHEKDCLAGLVLKPATPVSALLPYLDKIDLVLVMSVEPGFGGQSFMPEALSKLREIKQEAKEKELPYLLIEVDGGITEENCVAVIEAGANVLVAGSAVFNAENPAHAIARLRNG